MTLRVWCFLLLLLGAGFAAWYLLRSDLLEPVGRLSIEPPDKCPTENRTLAHLHNQPTSEPVSATRTILVRSLADGKGISGLPVHIEHSGSDASRRVTDALGLLSLEAAWDVSHFRLEAGRHLAVYESSTQVLSDGVLWVAGMGDVSGRVVLLGPGATQEDLANCKVELVVTGKVNPANTDGLLEPWTPRWLSSHGYHFLVQIPIDSLGAFSARLPMVDSTVVRASCTGYAPAWARLDVRPRDASLSPIELVLRRGKTIRGQILDGNDQPVRMQRVTGYIHISPSDAQTFNDLQAIAPRSFGASRSASGNFDITYVIDIAVAADGKFEVGVPLADGRLQLVAYANARAPLRRHGADKETNELGVLRLGDENPHTVTLLFKGIALAGAQVTLSDVTDTPVQSSVDTMLDAQGRMPIAWFERERAYWIIARGFDEKVLQTEDKFVDGIFVWDGRTSLDLSEMRATFDDVIPEDRR